MPLPVAIWKAEQQRLREAMTTRPLAAMPRYVAGVDCAFSRDKQSIYAAAVVWDREKKAIVEQVGIKRPATVPYVPGYLSFREGPAILEAVGKLTRRVDAFLFDGQGYAHPRRCGLATHLGVTLNAIAAGVGKSRLIGTFDPPGSRRGDSSPLRDGDEIIGVVLTTKNDTRPLFVSVGNQIDLAGAMSLTLACVTTYRLPEPTRWADREVARVKRESEG